MKKHEKQKQLLLAALSTVPVASGKQLERYFMDYKHPDKRLSSALKELETEGLVEGKNRELGMSKIWRLSKKGRDLMEVDRHPVPLTTHNINHYLKVGDVYFQLEDSEQFECFFPEVRLPFTNFVGEERKYCPDAFFVLDNCPYFLEVQLSPLSRNGWSYKWEVASQMKSSGAWKKAPFREYLTDSFPSILVLSEQKESIIRQTTELDIKITNDLLTFFPQLKEVQIQTQTETDFSKLDKQEVLHLLSSFEKDLELSKQTYMNLSLGKEMEQIPLFSLDAVRKYQQLYKYLYK